MTSGAFDVTGVKELGAFEFRWPDATELFERGWQFELHHAESVHQVVHRLGERQVYGRHRVHTVTWLNGAVQVEGVEADDYPTTRALLSVLRHRGRAHVRDYTDVPVEYAGFEIVRHRAEIEAPYSPNSLAVKIGEDDLLSWGRHAWIRRSSRQSVAAPSGVSPVEPPAMISVPVPPRAGDRNRRAVADALLTHGKKLSESIGGGTVRFTPDDDADALVRADAFAFLVAVICDQGIQAERAWAIPYVLRQRLGHLDPVRVGAEPDIVRRAFVTSPKLHRFVNTVADWVSAAGRIVADRYGGEAARIWDDRPSAAGLRSRLEVFPGIGQKKAAMAVEILERDLKIPLTDLSGSDIAYDVHVRRVFLRTGIAVHDDVGHMVAEARALHPERPGELDNPSWDVGRRWCHREAPDCPTCPLVGACPRLIERGTAVKGI